MDEIICRRCGATDHVRNGIVRGLQRYRCETCRRRFGDQTFSTTYWLKRPDLLVPVFHRLVGCSGFRQIAREFGVSPQTIGRVSRRLGRHALLYHEQNRPHGPLEEPLALDSFVTFEYSQFYPTSFHVAVGQDVAHAPEIAGDAIRGNMDLRVTRESAVLVARLANGRAKSLPASARRLLRRCATFSSRLSSGFSPQASWHRCCLAKDSARWHRRFPCSSGCRRIRPRFGSR